MDTSSRAGFDRHPAAGLDVLPAAMSCDDPPPALRPRLTCNQLRDADVEAAARLLAIGFPERSEAYWRQGLARLGARRSPAGFPRYGYAMRDGDRLVGIILLLVSVDAAGVVRGNISSWYVDPAYRGFSAILAAMPLRLREVTLFNISPAAETHATIEAQGFRRYVAGTFHAFACLAPRVPGVTARIVGAEEVDLAATLVDLARAGCICVEVFDGTRTHPFAFLPTRIVKGRLRAAQLVFCQATDDFARFAGTLGPLLLRKGFVSVTLDADGPLAGVPGKFNLGSRVKYCRGPNPPRLNDLSQTELVIFGP